MQRKQWEKRLQVSVLLALFTAMSIVFGKYLAIPGGNVMRFSFENLPILLAGICFGPFAGAIVGAAADLIGCMLVGYSINPVVTLGAVAIGCVSGLCARFLPGRSLVVRVAVSVIAAHLVGSVLIKTYGLAKYYDMPLLTLMLWRACNYLIVGAAEGILSFLLLKNNAIVRILAGLGGMRWQKKKEGVQT